MGNDLKMKLFCVFSLLTIFGYATGDFYKTPVYNTKTPYFFVVDSSSANVIENDYSFITHGSNKCRIEGLSLMLRHGARYPTLKWIKRISDLLKALKEDVNVVSKHPFLEKFNNPFSESDDGLLSPLGEQEMLALGQRFGKKFKDLLENRTNEIRFRTSRKERTKTSYEYFFKGLNDTLGVKEKNAPDATIDNVKTRFYDFCQKYSDEVDENDDALKEHDDFEKMSKIRNVVGKVKTKLGLKDDAFDFDKVLVMQQLCAFEMGLNGTTNWCNFFDLDDLKIIEYLNDLEDYYKVGYGYPINWKQTCPFTSYLFERFDEKVENFNNNSTSQFPIDIFFGHSESIIPIFTALKLFKDSDKLTADMYDDPKVTNRLFRTSTVAPFSANIAIALYRCNGADEFFIQMYVNEKLVSSLPACGGSTCSYSDVKEYYDDLVDCDFDDICDDSVSSTPQIKMSIICLLFCILLTCILCL